MFLNTNIPQYNIYVCILCICTDQQEIRSCGGVGGEVVGCLVDQEDGLVNSHYSSMSSMFTVM